MNSQWEFFKQQASGNRLISLNAVHMFALIPTALIVFYLFNMIEYANQAGGAEIKRAN